MPRRVQDRVDRFFIRQAVELADPDALRMALYHQTGDDFFAQMPVSTKMNDAQRSDLLARAEQWLEANAGSNDPRPLSDVELREMFEMAVGGPVGDLEYESRKEVTSFREFPWFAEWEGEKPEIPDSFCVAIIGGGFSGITMAAQLDHLGIDYVVLERNAKPGGVWDINRYPDVRVDTISITYELPFVKKKQWNEYFAQGHEVGAYLEEEAERYGVTAKTRFGHDVVETRFDTERDCWNLVCETADGTETIQAAVIVTCAGLYATPKLPDIDGLSSFGGRIVHSARWPEDLDLNGLKVATIGNGSTGVQLLKPIAEVAEHVHVFQRTPQWIGPREKYGDAIPKQISWLVENLPGYWNWWRFCATAPLFETHSLVTVDDEWRAKGGIVNEQSDALRKILTEYIKEQTDGDQGLFDRLLPNYAPFSRRPVVDNQWYKSLTRDNVDLVTTPIARFTEKGIETSDGDLCEVDVIVIATGFEVAKFLAPARFIGKTGADLHESWETKDGARAYLGMMYPDYPNLFSLYGPNSQPVSGGPSQPTWFAIWANFVAQSLMRMLQEKKSRVEVTQSAYDRYNRDLDQEAKQLVAMSDLGGYDRNYYVNQKHGRLQVNAPWYSPDYWHMCAHPDWDDLEFN